jgi:hypothetical protein
MVKIAYLQEMVKSSVTIWEHIGTNENVADMFTKALNKVKFSDLLKKLQLDQSK